MQLSGFDEHCLISDTTPGGQANVKGGALFAQQERYQIQTLDTSI